LKICRMPFQLNMRSSFFQLREAGYRKRWEKLLQSQSKASQANEWQEWGAKVAARNQIIGKEGSCPALICFCAKCRKLNAMIEVANNEGKRATTAWQCNRNGRKLWTSN
jgi:hypothetical protein